MDLDELLTSLDKVGVNLRKLEDVWALAQPYLPEGPARGTEPEYVKLSRTWKNLLLGLPKIDGWTITEELPDMDQLGQMYLDYAEMGELPNGAWKIAEQPTSDLMEYRFRLDETRQRTIAQRLTVLCEQIDRSLATIISSIPTREVFFSQLSSPREKVSTAETAQVANLIQELDRLLGDAVERRGRWGDLHRHLRFGEVHDWHDIFESDWPSVSVDIEAAKAGADFPVPVPDLDLGELSKTALVGSASTELKWSTMPPTGFERLLFDLMRALGGYENVQWLTNTNAPDRGRDLSLDQVIRTPGGSTRFERVIVQAKHYLRKSIGPSDIVGSLSRLPLLEPPVIRTLIIASSGRFTSDAIEIIEKHNNGGNRPFIEMWPDSQLEALLAQHPHLAIIHGLRE